MNKAPDEPNLLGVRAQNPALDMLSERASALIEHDILAGIFQPNGRLGIAALSEKYGIGATPLREGLSRLISRGLVVAIGKRGFRVADVSKADLNDITQLRILIETDALRRSLRDGGDEWEANILSSLHLLVRWIERNRESMREGTPEFDRLHKNFHRSLLDACGSDRLMRLHDDLYFQAYRYRRVMMGRFDNHENFIAIHEMLANVVLQRDAPRAVNELTKHLMQTLDIVYVDLPVKSRGIF